MVCVDPVDQIMSRLQGAKPAGKGFTARCPAHEDRSPSLSIDRRADGAALVKCWAGCNTGDVMAALGLTLADLFPERPKIDYADRPARDKAADRWREARERVTQATWAAALPVLAYRSAVVLLAARALKQGEPLNDEDMAALVEAEQLIADARALLVPPEPSKYDLKSDRVVFDSAGQRPLPRKVTHG